MKTRFFIFHAALALYSAVMVSLSANYSLSSWQSVSNDELAYILKKLLLNFAAYLVPLTALISTNKYFRRKIDQNVIRQAFAYQIIFAVVLTIVFVLFHQ